MYTNYRIGALIYVASFIAITFFAVLPYISDATIKVKAEAAQLQDRAMLVAALETIHNSPELLMKIRPVEGSEAGQIVVLTDEIGRETQMDPKSIRWDRWCGTEVELAFERARKITGLNREELRVLAANPSQMLNGEILVR